jgi:SAM-dependent methyltransferase
MISSHDRQHFGQIIANRFFQKFCQILLIPKIFKMEELLFDRKLLRARKSRFAEEFLQRNFLHHEIGRRILENLELQNRKFLRILEIGASDDFFVRNCSKFHFQSFVVASQTAINFEKNLNSSAIFQIICDDEDLPFAKKKSSEVFSEGFDLVISNLNLHFINNLPKFLLSVRQILREEGLFVASFFGERNLWQLAESVYLAQNQIYHGVSPIMPPTIEIKTAANLLLKCGFSNPVSDLEKIEFLYSSLSNLLADIKFCSASNLMLARQNRLFSRRFLNQIEQNYRQKFAKENGEIPTSFEVLTISGEV